MTFLLDNELVKKYFGCKCGTNFDGWHMAHLILQSMQEPIRRGDRVLEWFPSADKWQEIIWNLTPNERFHPAFLRLPDKFQERKNERFDLPSDFRIWGYSLTELRHMRDYAQSHGFPANVNPEPQRDEVKCNCGTALGKHLWDCNISVTKRNDEVEKKINEIYVYHHDGHVLKETASLDQRLRELVRLAKDTK